MTIYHDYTTMLKAYCNHNDPPRNVSHPPYQDSDWAEYFFEKILIFLDSLSKKYSGYLWAGCILVSLVLLSIGIGFCTFSIKVCLDCRKTFCIEQQPPEFVPLDVLSSDSHSLFTGNCGGTAER
jgi:hypothetical protein